MTPQEKAKELIETFKPFTWSGYSYIGVEEVEMMVNNPKECSLICVDEIIKATESVSDGSLVIDNEWTTIGEYWENVKKKLQAYDTL